MGGGSRSNKGSAKKVMVEPNTFWSVGISQTQTVMWFELCVCVCVCVQEVGFGDRSGLEE